MKGSFSRGEKLTYSPPEKKSSVQREQCISPHKEVSLLIFQCDAKYGSAEKEVDRTFFFNRLWKIMMIMTPINIIMDAILGAMIQHIFFLDNLKTARLSFS